MTNENRELIKQYKNGNKVWRYYEKCEVCGGTGFLKIYAYHDEGVCYTCNGTGIHTWVEKELTPENQEKQEAKWHKEFVKREAKRLQKEIDECHRKALIENKWFDQKKAEAEASGYVGNIGDKITVKLTLTVSFYWETQYGTQYMHLMKDASGNVYKWMTSRSLGYDVPAIDKNDYYMEDENGQRWTRHMVEEHNKEEFTITATIKDHAEYKGTKQTVLTRCKVKAA